MKLFLVMILESKYKVFLHTRRGQTQGQKNSTELRQNFIDNRTVNPKHRKQGINLEFILGILAIA